MSTCGTCTYWNEKGAPGGAGRCTEPESPFYGKLTVNYLGCPWWIRYPKKRSKEPKNEEVRLYVKVNNVWDTAYEKAKIRGHDHSAAAYFANRCVRRFIRSASDTELAIELAFVSSDYAKEAARRIKERAKNNVKSADDT